MLAGVSRTSRTSSAVIDASRLHLASALLALHSSGAPPPLSPALSVDIEAVHDLACARRESTYIDAATSYSVFTAAAHVSRGSCCGSCCRHCPYGNFRVKPGGRRARLARTTLLLCDAVPSAPARHLYSAAFLLPSCRTPPPAFAEFLQTHLVREGADARHSTLLVATFEPASYRLLSTDSAAVAPAVSGAAGIDRPLFLDAAMDFARTLRLDILAVAIEDSGSGSAGGAGACSSTSGSTSTGYTEVTAAASPLLAAVSAAMLTVLGRRAVPPPTSVVVDEATGAIATLTEIAAADGHDDKTCILHTF